MNRIDQKFKELKARKKKAFIAFITAGDPNLQTTKELVLAFEKTGVDIVELGVPYSDPLADGPTIQAASQRALKHHVTLEKILHLVAEIRKVSDLPIALMTYYNPIFHYGEEKFIRDAKRCGVDGVIIPDLPPEEGKKLIALAREENLSTVFFVAPTTTKERMKGIVSATSGFIYYASITVVTGGQVKLPKEILSHIRLVKTLTDKPVCVGFGISTRDQVEMMSKVADGVIVGSAIVKEIERNRGNKNLVKEVTTFVSKLLQGGNSGRVVK